jgi:gamma-glutamylcyclotransferase (GGCT)/AIG2-like uncharacterized protein YtfP
MTQLPLFAFGTLRCGKSNHGTIAGAFDRMLPATLRDFRRGVAPHGFPTIVRCPLAHVEGELFFLRPDLYDETLRRCDLLEEIPSGQLAGSYYRRMEVRVETTEGEFTAWVYADANLA